VSRCSCGLRLELLGQAKTIQTRLRNVMGEARLLLVSYGLSSVMSGVVVLRLETRMRHVWVNWRKAKNTRLWKSTFAAFWLPHS